MKKVKIMIDPGHGGRDPGAVANGLQEKNLVLTIAKHIQQTLLQNYHVDVRMTRERDTFVSLEGRAELANAWGADYFLSIHINAGGGSGFETFTFTKAGSKTKEYQKAVHEEIATRLYEKDRGMKEANFAVLRSTRMPAVLTENLFIDHPKDSLRLKDATVLKAIAQGHVNGLMRLLKLTPIRTSSAPTFKGERAYRVLINDKQIGAYKEKENVLAQVEQHLKTATKIEVQQL